MIGELFRLRKNACGKSGKIGRTQRRRFQNHGTIDRRIEQIGQALSATKGECAEDNWFTFAVGELAATTNDVTTDAVDADSEAAATCTADTLRGYDANTGGTRPKGSYDVFVLPPSGTAFLQGQRWFACLARLTS